MLDEDFNIVTTAPLGIRNCNIIESSKPSNDLVIELVHEGGEFVCDDKHGVVFKGPLRESDYGSLGVDKSVDHGSH